MVSFGFEIEFLWLRLSAENFRFTKGVPIAYLKIKNQNIFQLTADGDLENQIQEAKLEIISHVYGKSKVEQKWQAQVPLDVSLEALSALQSYLEKILVYSAIVDQKGQTNIIKNKLPFQKGSIIGLNQDFYIEVVESFTLEPIEGWCSDAMHISPHFTFGMPFSVLKNFYTFFDPVKYDTIWDIKEAEKRCYDYSALYVFKKALEPFGVGTKEKFIKLLESKETDTSYDNLYQLTEYLKFYLGCACAGYWAVFSERGQLKFAGYKALFGLLSRTSFKYMFAYILKLQHKSVITKLESYIKECLSESIQKLISSTEEAMLFNAIYNKPPEERPDLFPLVYDNYKIGKNPTDPKIPKQYVKIDQDLRLALIKNVGNLTYFFESIFGEPFSLKDQITSQNNGGVTTITNINFPEMPLFYRELLTFFKNNMNGRSIDNNPWTDYINNEILMLRNIAWYDWFCPVPTAPPNDSMGSYTRDQSVGKSASVIANYSDIVIIENRNINNFYIEVCKADATCFDMSFFKFIHTIFECTSKDFSKPLK